MSEGGARTNNEEVKRKPLQLLLPTLALVLLSSGCASEAMGISFEADDSSHNLSQRRMRKLRNSDRDQMELF